MKWWQFLMWSPVYGAPKTKDDAKRVLRNTLVAYGVVTVAYLVIDHINNNKQLGNGSIVREWLLLTTPFFMIDFIMIGGE